MRRGIVPPAPRCLGAVRTSRGCALTAHHRQHHTLVRDYEGLTQPRELLQSRLGAGLVEALEAIGMPAQRVQRELPGVGKDILRAPHQERNADPPASISLLARDLYRQGDSPPQRKFQATHELPTSRFGRE